MSYRIEVFDQSGDRWVCAMGDRHLPRGYADGYLDAVARGPSPRLAHRLVRERDGKVLRELPALTDVGIGSGVGWPTWQQHVRAARKALERAADAVLMTHDASSAEDRWLRGWLQSMAAGCADLIERQKGEPP